MNGKTKTVWTVEPYMLRLKRNGHTRALIYKDENCRTYFGVGPLFDDKENPPEQSYSNNLAKLKLELLGRVLRGGF